ncbi:hypothetical protein DAEQUDRAFT_727941 [Daedalea quercina L-15889]|uniref:Fungal-type protein kinase domain-containing protein n=1 Tax=Daedalea quercina L-15889 TaxID=1314783 RepID=A0A165PLZ2_9APHY|nr:hypothetical protein DAEQUDRAFT_727941 [Daedalea quercina L-15889]
MAKYMPGTDLPESLASNIPVMDKKVLLGRLENPICETICKVAQVIFDGCLVADENKLVARNTSHNSDSTDRGDYASQLKPDVCFYPIHKDAQSDYVCTGSKSEVQAITRWAWISLMIEVQIRREESAFAFDKKDGDGDGERGSAANPEDAVGEENNGPQELRDSTNDGTKRAKAAKKRSKKTGKSDTQSGGSDEKQEPEAFVRSGSGAEWSLGQAAEYVAMLFRRQHRLHVFTLFICKGQARVICWDRAGAVVSTPIDFEKDPSLLHKVIWRYSRMDQVQRGFDPTVTLATENEIKDMRACPAPDEWVAKCRNDALGQPGWPVYKIMMRRKDRIPQQDLKPINPSIPLEDVASADDCLSADEEGGAKYACFIVGMRYFASSSPTGRGTKCYVAYDVSRKRLVFLKDYWRSVITSSTPEGEVLTDLRTKGVQNVPTPIAAGDVLDGADKIQETRTHASLSQDERTQRSWPVQRHYRLVMKEVCRPLALHETPADLVTIIYDALDAHKQAWEIAEIMHRDISAANILWLPYTDADGKAQIIGILADWDLCKSKEYLERVSRPGRSGTWQFMSANLLRNPGKKHEVADDLEAFVHVLRWMCLRFVEHSLTTMPDTLKQYVLAVFEMQDVQHEDKRDEIIGGGVKHNNIRNGHKVVRLTKPNTPLGKLLETLTMICRQHYLAVDPPSENEPGVNTTTDQPVVNLGRLKELRQRSSQTDSRVQTPVVVPALLLSDHSAIMTAFADALLAPGGKWAPLQKTNDQFEQFEDSTFHQSGMARSSQRSSSLKRSMDEPADTEKPRSPKRSKRMTVPSQGTGLESLPEEPVAADAEIVE